jgi:hypothetical protein
MMLFRLLLNRHLIGSLARYEKLCRLQGGGVVLMVVLRIANVELLILYFLVLIAVLVVEVMKLFIFCDGCGCRIYKKNRGFGGAAVDKHFRCSSCGFDYGAH